MDRSRATELLLVALATVVLFLLLVPYSSVILAAILLAYLLGPPHRWLAQYVGLSLAAVVVILGTLVLALLPFVPLFTVVVNGLDQVQAVVQESLGEIEDLGLGETLRTLFGGEGPIQVPAAQSVQNVDLGAAVPVVLDTLGGGDFERVRRPLAPRLSHLRAVECQRSAPRLARPDRPRLP